MTIGKASPEIGKLYYIKRKKVLVSLIESTSSYSSWPAIGLWEADVNQFGADCISKLDEIYSTPLLFLGLMEHACFSETNEVLAEFLYCEKTYWTDWFNVEKFFDYFELCKQTTQQ